MNLKILIRMTGLMALIVINSLIAYSQPFDLHSFSDLATVFEDGYKLPPAKDTLRVFGLRAETVSGQIAVNAKVDLKDMTVEISPLLNPENGKSFPVSDVEWNFTGSVLLPANAPNQPADVVLRPAPARFPDFLMAERKIDVGKGKYQAIWLTFKIPEKAEAGIYKGFVAVKCLQGNKSIPVEIKIYPLTLPSERHLKIAIRFSLNNFAKYHGIEEVYSGPWFAMLGKYAGNMAEHRQNVIQAPLNAIDISLSKGGELQFDFDHFDRIVQVFLDTRKMDFIETGYGLTRFGEGDWFSPVIELSDFMVKDILTGNKKTLPGKEVVPVLLPAFERHLRQKGWLGKTLLSVRNEPSLHNAVIYDELSDYFHQLAPDLKQFESIETTMYGGLDIPGPKLDHLATWYDTFREDQEKGKEICYYIVGIYQGSRFPDKTIDVPVMDSRIMPWLNYKYDLSGIKHWGWNSWTDDPFKQVGQHLGDGWHVYPVKNGILNSLRWEQMRNGIQDYECFYLLESRIKSLKDSLGPHFSWMNPRQRGVEIAGKVVQGFADRTNDPEILYKSKLQAIHEILEFYTSPMVYIQTNPVEKSVLTAGSSVEVFGWTKPGTKITINNKEIPVHDDGLFLEQFTISPANNKIRVQASGEGQTKEILREFTLK